MRFAIAPSCNGRRTLTQPLAGISFAKTARYGPKRNTIRSDGVGDRTARPASWAKPWNVYKDVFGAWRWEMMDAVGEIWDSPGSFDSYNECLAAVKREIRRIGPVRDIDHPTDGVRKERHGHQKAHHAP